jgi:hypothetical protein
MTRDKEPKSDRADGHPPKATYPVWMERIFASDVSKLSERPPSPFSHLRRGQGRNLRGSAASTSGDDRVTLTASGQEQARQINETVTDEGRPHDGCAAAGKVTAMAADYAKWHGGRSSIPTIGRPHTFLEWRLSREWIEALRSWMRCGCGTCVDDYLAWSNELGEAMFK